MILKELKGRSILVFAGHGRYVLPNCVRIDDMNENDENI